MKLEYSGQERITAGAATVWAFVTDPDQIARCLPDVVSVTVRDPTHFDAVVRVGLGAVRGNLKLAFELQPDPAARRMDLRIAGSGLGSALDMTAGADIRDTGDGATLLDWMGEAIMRGPVAAVGGRVLDAQARKLIAQTFADVGQRLSTARRVRTGSEQGQNGV